MLTNDDVNDEELYFVADETCFSVVVVGGIVVIWYGVERSNRSTTWMIPFVVNKFGRIIFASISCQRR